MLTAALSFLKGSKPGNWLKELYPSTLMRDIELWILSRHKYLVYL